MWKGCEQELPGFLSAVSLSSPSMSASRWTGRNPVLEFLSSCSGEDLQGRIGVYSNTFASFALTQVVGAALLDGMVRACQP